MYLTHYKPFEHLTEHFKASLLGSLQMVSIKWQTFQKSSIAMSVIVRVVFRHFFGKSVKNQNFELEKILAELDAKMVEL